MLTMVTRKKANGRQTAVLVLEPDDIDGIKKSNLSVADSAKLEGVDIIVAYTPDVRKFEQMVRQEMPELRPEIFKRILETVQQLPEVRRGRVEKTAKQPLM